LPNPVGADNELVPVNYIVVMQTRQTIRVRCPAALCSETLFRAPLWPGFTRDNIGVRGSTAVSGIGPDQIEVHDGLDVVDVWTRTGPWLADCRCGARFGIDGSALHKQIEKGRLMPYIILEPARVVRQRRRDRTRRRAT
jgi:hypothetical protein